MMWACIVCGKERIAAQESLDPRWATARCVRCRQERVHQRTEPVAVARNTDPETSHMAAASVKDIRASQRMIYGALERHGPGTDEDIYEWLKTEGHKISLSGARTRRSELVRLGLVMDSRRRRMLASKRLSIIWRVK